MLALPGYNIKEKIHESNHFFIYRGYRMQDNVRIVCKLLKDPQPTQEQLLRVQHEYELAKGLDGNGTVKVYALEKNQNNQIIIFEDYGTESLRELLKKQKLFLKEFLHAALSITEALEKIHSHRIIHKDINPNNILYDATTNEVKIIDFSIAHNLPREIPEVKNPKLLEEGTLFYMSPEQTGRMNRGIDYRTDFYSLGVTFYEMATGTLPFDNKDIGEYIHFLIAKMPTPPHEVNSDIPQVVSNIIMKLLAKTAEERYQSTFGLKKDLLRCLSQLDMTGTIIPFNIASADVSRRFHITEKLYGREEEIEILMQAFARASIGKAELILITGYPGIGKSTLVHELYKPLVEKRGYFISGKFDQFKKNIPYAAIIQAIEDLISQFLNEDKESIQKIKHEIMQAVGVNGQLVINVIPLLKKLIGEQPPMPNLGFQETQNRFNMVFQSLLHALITPERPLAIYLDDLQWADNYSLKLIENLLQHSQSNNFLVIGAYRDNEVDHQHILINTLEELRKTVTINTILLKPLAINQIKAFLADTLHHDTETVSALANIAYEKTHGNPFFLNQLTQTLYDKGLIEFDIKEGKWTWHIKNIQNINISDNVVDLMILKIEKLSKSAQSTLRYASCLGNRFDIQSLIISTEKSRPQIANDLNEAIYEGLITPLSDNYKFAGEIANANVSYQFLHDRIQQAAYSLIAATKLPALHLKIGQLLWKNTPAKKFDEKLLDITNHIDYGIHLVTNDTERIAIAELNLKAKKKAISAIAFKLALKYIKNAIELLPENAWEQHYFLTLEIFTEAMQAAYFANTYTEMDSYLEIVLKNAKNILDTVTVYEIKMQFLIYQARFAEATNLGLSILSKLDINITKKPSIFKVMFHLLRLKWVLSKKRADELLNLPEIQDVRLKAALRLLKITSTPAHFTNRLLFPLLIFKGLDFTLAHGNSYETSYFYSVYTSIIYGYLHDVSSTKKFAKLALNLYERFQNTTAKPMIEVEFLLTHVNSAFTHSEELKPSFDEIFEKGVTVGDVYIGFVAIVHLLHLVVSGKEVPFILKRAEYYYEWILAFNQQSSDQNLSILWQGLLNLMEQGKDDPTLLIGTKFDESKQLEKLQRENDIASLVIAYQLKTTIAFLLEDYDKAYEFTVKAQSIINNFTGKFYLPIVVYFYSLVCLALYTKPNHPIDKKTLIKQIKKNQKLVKKYADKAPMNFLHRYYIIEAELANVLGDEERASTYFDLAISTIRNYHYILDDGIANELAANFYLKYNHEKIAIYYINEAYQAYRKYGATIKIKQFSNKYKKYLKKSSKDNGKTSLPQLATPEISAAVNLNEIIRIANSISREINLSNLLKYILQTVLKISEAATAYLLLSKNNSWYIAAQAVRGNNEINFLHTVSYEEKISNLIIKNVAQTKDILLIDSPLLNEFHVKNQEASSAICLPLLDQGKLNGILYLEDYSENDLFSQDKINTLKLLTAEIVISIDNARLYADMQEANKAYARFFPHEYLKFLNKNSIIDIRVGDQAQQEMAVLFCDIRNFTSISEQMDPKENMEFLNNLLRMFVPIITKHEGFISQYIGDAIMALYPHCADDALSCAIEMLATLNQLNQFRISKQQAPIEMGFGLNSGVILLGTLGNTTRMEVTVISDAVSSAATLEELTKQYRAPILITHTVYEQLKDTQVYQIRKVDMLNQPEAKQGINIYEVYDNDNQEIRHLKNKTLADFEKGVELFHEQKISDAYALFKKIYKLNPQDLPTHFYLKRCRKILAQHKIKSLS